MEFISFTDAAKRKDASRTTLYRAADDGRINSRKIAGRRLVVDDDTFSDYEPRNVGRRAARQKKEAGE